MARRRPTAAQLRDHRSKQLALGLGVVFVIVAVVQVPRLMKQLNPAKPAQNAGTGLVAASPAAPVSPGAETGVVSQLTDLSQFPLKDPFHPLVKATTTTAASAAAPAVTATATSPPAASRPAASPPAAKAKAPVAPAVPTPFISTPPPPPDAALIVMNGQRQVVALGDPFPLAQPLFKLVALEKQSVRIGVYAGSFASGIPTLAVAAGHKITLVDQVDGSRYTLELVRLTVATPAPSQPTVAPAVTTTTPAAPATALGP